MIEFKDKKIYFSAQGEKCDKEELVKYFIQNGGEMVESLNEADMIIQGYMTPVHLEDKFYLLSKEGKEIIEIQELEKQFSRDLDVDSIVMAIKISKDKERLIKLLNNRYFSDDIFVILLKYYNWENEGLHDNDENRDVSTAIVNRFCSLQETNHNIQHSPIGIYYTALETTNGKLLETIYNMPEFRISDKNAHEDQPLSLKEVVALNPNTPKPLLIQILKNNNLEELKFLAQNESINKMISNKLYGLNNYTITKSLIISGNLDNENINEVLNDEKLKVEVLKNIKLSDEIFENIVSNELSDIEVVYLSSNSSLSTIQIGKLFRYDVENANINLLKNPNANREKLKEFLEKNDLVYNIAIAHNENLDHELFGLLADLDELNINITLSMNTKTPKDIIKRLYEKNTHEINTGLSLNDNTPINILMQLQVDNRYTTNVANNETYREFSRNSLGIIQEENNRFKRTTYDMDSFFND